MIIAHRGASAYAPENTLSAFKAALALGCHFIEFDVMLSLEGQAFVFHDKHLNRTSNGKGKFYKKFASEIQTLDAGSWFSKAFEGEKIPSLALVLDWLRISQVKANMEIKTCAKNYDVLLNSILFELKRHQLLGGELPLISSFNITLLRLCRTAKKELALGILLHKWRKDCLDLAQELQCYSVHLHYSLLNATRIQAIKEGGHQLYAYTVNNKLKAIHYLRAGVDGILSDYPDLLTKT